jgi:hypothetical protein
MAFCSHCGTEMSDQARACPQCGHPVHAGGAAVAGAVVPNYLVQSILVTLFCCLPFGIVSIVYASQVNTKLGVGDIAGAQLASDNAKKWSWISFGVGIVVIIGSFLVSVMSEMNSTNF